MAQTSKSHSMSMTLANDHEPIGIGSSSDLISVTFAKASGTTAYSIGDVVGPAPTAVPILEDCARINGGTGLINYLRLSSDNATVTNAAFRVYVFQSSPVAIDDNAVMTRENTDKLALVGYIDLTLTTEGGGSDMKDAFTDMIRWPFKCALDSRDLYAMVVAKAAYTPASIEQMTVVVGVDRN